MMKYVVNEDKQTIMAFLEGTRYDAVKIVNKQLVRTGIPVDYFSEKLLMPNKYSGTVTLRSGDVWDEEEGKRQAKAKCLANYHRGLEKRLNTFYFDMSMAATLVGIAVYNSVCSECEGSKDDMCTHCACNEE